MYYKTNHLMALLSLRLLTDLGVVNSKIWEL